MAAKKKQKNNNKSTSNKEVASNNLVEKNNNSKSLAVKKEAKKVSKSPVVKKDKPKVDTAKAINKYKDVPLGDLYNELGGMRNYIEVLEERRKELIQAKSILDKKKRLDAIKKTTDNTYDIKFKYQDATFRKHNVPSNINLELVEKANGPQGDGGRTRVMENSQLKEISDAQQSIPRQEFVRRQVPSQPQQVNIQSTMQRSALHNVNQAPSQTPPQQGPAPFGQMMPPQQGPAPFGQMMQQQMMQQQMTQQQTTTTTVVNNVVKPALPPLDVEPLYKRIHKVILNTRPLKILYVAIIILGVLLILLTTFIILWGFASDWKLFDPNYNIQSNFVNDFKNFFGHLFDIKFWK